MICKFFAFFSIIVERADFEVALRALTPASARVAPTPAMSLAPHLQPLLKAQLGLVTTLLNTMFPLRM